jgi:hypothetical protein
MRAVHAYVGMSLKVNVELHVTAAGFPRRHFPTPVRRLPQIPVPQRRDTSIRNSRSRFTVVLNSCRGSRHYIQRRIKALRNRRGEAIDRLVGERVRYGRDRLNFVSQVVLCVAHKEYPVWEVGHAAERLRRVRKLG